MIFDLCLISSLTWPDLWTNLIPALTSSLIENWSPLLLDLISSPLRFDPNPFLNWSRLGFDIRSDFQDLWSETDLLELILRQDLWSATFTWVDLSLTRLIPSLTTPLIGNCSDTISNEAGKESSIWKSFPFTTLHVLEKWKAVISISLTSFSYNIKVQWSERSVNHQSSWPSWGLLKLFSVKATWLYCFLWFDVLRRNAILVSGRVYYSV